MTIAILLDRDCPKTPARGGPGARHVRGEGPKTDHAIAVAHEILGQPEVISINNSALLHSWQPLVGSWDSVVARPHHDHLTRTGDGAGFSQSCILRDVTARLNFHEIGWDLVQ